MENSQEVDVQQAKQLIGQGNITIVDIRNQDAFEEGHIEGALWVNVENIDEFVENTDKNRPVLCYCYMGFKSREVSQYLREQGFETVYGMKGGFTAWQENEHCSEKLSGEGL